MSCCSLLDLMWSLNPIELQGIVVRPHSSPSPCAPSRPRCLHLHLHPQALLCSQLLPPLPFLSLVHSGLKQNFFKCLIFPPLASFLQAPSHLFVHRFFIPLQPPPPHPPLAAPPPSFYPPPPPPTLTLPLAFSPSSSSAPFPPTPPITPAHQPPPPHHSSPLLLMQTDLFIYFKLVAQVICGR